MKQSFSSQHIMYGGLVTSLLLLWFQLTAWDSALLGWVLLAVYLFALSYAWDTILNQIFRIRLDAVSGRLLSLFAGWIMLTFVGAVLVVLYTLTPLLSWLTYMLTAVITLFLSRRRTGKRKRGKKGIELKTSWVLFHRSPLLLLVFGILSLLLLLLFIRSGSSDVLFSPWQSLHAYILPTFFLLTVTLGILLLSKHKIKILLLLVIVHSFLVHLYVPASHTLPYGGDVWRHIAAEEQLVSGETILPVLVGEESKWRSVAGFSIPEAFLIPHKYIYGQFWAGATLVAQTTRLDLVTLNKWYIPILWGIFLPILLFLLARQLFGSLRLGLWAAFLGSIPFALQALGSITLPNSLGLLSFLFVLVLLFRYLASRDSQQGIIVFLFAVFLLFGYSLYAILLWFVMFLCILFSSIEKIRYPLVQLAAKTSLYVMSFFVLPCIDVVAGGTFFVPGQNWIERIKMMVGELSGWYFASAIRPHDMVSGNILFNHTPTYAFVPHLFSDWRWIVLVGMIGVWLSFAYAGISLLKVRGLIYRSAASLMLVVFGGYIVVWYALSGERLFVRRLDALFAVLCMFAFLYGVRVVAHILSQRWITKKKYQRMLAGVGVVFIALFATVSYASGPDLRVSSVDEYAIAEAAVDFAQKDTPPCIIGDIWTLLIVEAVSAGEIVGGGFPIDQYFNQPELRVLYNEFLHEPRESILSLGIQITGGEKCLVIAHKTLLDSELTDVFEGAVGPPIDQNGDQIMWMYPIEERT